MISSDEYEQIRERAEKRREAQARARAEQESIERERRERERQEAVASAIKYFDHKLRARPLDAFEDAGCERFVYIDAKTADLVEKTFREHNWHTSRKHVGGDEKNGLCEHWIVYVHRKA